jgi:hypothetical protein
VEDGVVKRPLIKEGAFKVELDVLFVGMGGFDIEQVNFA